ncbi:hypothetical protein [Novosphingobium sp. 9U]|uniref:hypothetical protein n=1 Tax=Novosphingobium sp. 9U TaxID=2653158 RepID=UPI0012EFF188|nr:hypothetical protein [Novosphingobium sp. 9U]VWX50632.1 hypothetical protein NOVOSPHI9U_30044 [Novosphingobium sp. 9U]
MANPAIAPALVVGSTAVQLLDLNACKPPKCYLNGEQDVVEWILDPLAAGEREQFRQLGARAGGHGKTKHKSLDCSIMDVADDIAYGVHDLEDAIALGLIAKDVFAAAVAERCPSFLDAVKAKYPGESRNDVFPRMVDGLFGGEGERKRYSSRLLHHFITAVSFEEHRAFAERLTR